MPYQPLFTSLQSLSFKDSINSFHLVYGSPKNFAFNCCALISDAMLPIRPLNMSYFSLTYQSNLFMHHSTLTSFTLHIPQTYPNIQHLIPNIFSLAIWHIPKSFCSFSMFWFISNNIFYVLRHKRNFTSNPLNSSKLYPPTFPPKHRYIYISPLSNLVHHFTL